MQGVMISDLPIYIQTKPILKASTKLYMVRCLKDNIENV